MAGVQVPKHIDVGKLKQPEIHRAVKEKLDTLEFDGTWEDFKDQVYSVGADLLGYRQRAHREWFDENDQHINSLLLDKQRLYQNLLNHSQANKASVEKAYKESRANLQRELRRMKNDWWLKLSQEVQHASDRKDAKTLYGLLNQVFGPKSSSITPLKSKDSSTLIKDPTKIQELWQVKQNT